MVGQEGFAAHRREYGTRAGADPPHSPPQPGGWRTPAQGGAGQAKKGASDEGGAGGAERQRRAQEDNEEEEVCPICLECFSGPLEEYQTPCGHTFHHTCITRILTSRTADGKHRCPTCRAKILVIESPPEDPARASADGPGVQQTIVLASQPHQSSPLEVFLEWGTPGGLLPVDPPSRKKWRVKKGLRALFGRLLGGAPPQR